ncbi:acyltransferase family protein [Streptomyces bugieae]|uniref:Acyltransferase family protein n=1 Tax=Streptomyces bugieae TaxID=3098223 RepID=A0ABU7NHI9_9ACTN|nr:acyltransferase family protein [Streptomyces sp. DSM 41528]
MTHDPGRPAVTVGPEPATGRPKPAARLFYIDNLRIVLTALVVLHHTAVTYGHIPAWYYTEPAKDGSGLVLDAFVMFNQAFFMGFFFMIAGYFTPSSYGRKGTRPFLRDRLKRLGIPLLAFILLIRPLVNFSGYTALRAQLAEQGRDLPYWLYYGLSWDAGPMWFVEVLLVFSLVYALVRHRRARGLAGPGSEGAGVRAPERAPRPLRPFAIVTFTLGLALATYLWRFVVPNGSYLPVLGLPTPSYLPQYASFFVIGVLAHRHGWPQTLSRVAGRVGFAVATVATLAYLPVVVTAGNGVLDGRGSWQSLAGAAWESTFAVGVVLGLTVLFRERFHRQGPVAAFLSRHAFAVYLTHAAVLVGLGYAFRWLHTLAVVKFALVAVLALPLCWAVAYAVRRLPRADRVL